MPRPNTKGKNRATPRVPIPPPALLPSPPRDNGQPEPASVAVPVVPRGDARGAFRGGRGAETGGRTGNNFQGRGKGGNVPRSPSLRVVSSSDQEYHAGLHKLSILVSDRQAADDSDAFEHESSMESEFFQSLLHVPFTLKSRGICVKYFIIFIFSDLAIVFLSHF